MSKIRTCILCGKEYEYCNRCAGVSKPAWLSVYDSDNCRKIFNAVSNYYGGINKDIVKEELEKCDLSRKRYFSSDVKKAINELFPTKEKKKEVEISE